MLSVGTFIYGLSYIPKKTTVPKDTGSGDQSQTDHHPAPPTSGTLELNSVSWKGMTAESGECLDAKILTGDVWWEIRLDRDNDRIYRLYPKDWDGKKRMDDPDGRGASYVEWRIAPGQAKDRGEMVFAKHKHGEPHRY